MPRYDTISFLSDYGHGDEFVGVVHSVVRSLAPDVHDWFVSTKLPLSEAASYLYAQARVFRAKYVVEHNVESFGLSEDKARLVVQGVRTVGDGGAFERRLDPEPARGAPELRPHQEVDPAGAE